MQKTYFQKLQDPRWQKKRLEALEAAEWTCQCCMDSESTLHVHHRAYFKGREPWDYEVKQLEVLCKDCHESHHEEEDKLKLVSSYVCMDGPFNRDSAASLVAGHCGLPLCKEFVEDPAAYYAGLVAFEMNGLWHGGLTAEELRLLAEKLLASNHDFIALVRGYLGTKAPTKAFNA